MADQLLQVSRTYRASGFTVHDFESTVLKAGALKSFTLTLKCGVRYVLRGMGDADALDIDLAVITKSNALVRKDVDHDATPCVEFTAPYSGEYTLLVKLPSCRVNGSYIGLLLAEK